MGRTLSTYRQRLLTIRERFNPIYDKLNLDGDSLWLPIHQASAAASATPTSDTYLPLTMTLIVELYMRIENLREKIRTAELKLKDNTENEKNISGIY